MLPPIPTWTAGGVLIATLAVLALISFIAIVILLLIGLKPRSASQASQYEYKSKRLMTDWEISAFKQLNAQLTSGLQLCPQVCLGEIVTPIAGDRSVRTSARNTVRQKAVDFVVADVSSGRAVLVVELDDGTHDRPDRRVRDRFVDDALAQANIPIARFRPRQAIDIARFLSDKRSRVI